MVLFFIALVGRVLLSLRGRYKSDYHFLNNYQNETDYQFDTDDSSNCFQDE